MATKSNKLNLDSVVKRYNRLMMGLCREHNTIGTEFSEDTENWNLRDMVAECDYALSTYYEDGHVNEEMRHGDSYEKRLWKSETGKLERFIERYKPYITDMQCTVNHCSNFDY